MRTIEPMKQLRTLVNTWSALPRLLRHLLAVSTCLWLAFCTSVGFIYRDNGSVSNATMLHVFIFALAFACYYAILSALTHVIQHGSCSPRVVTMARTIVSIMKRVALWPWRQCQQCSIVARLAQPIQRMARIGANMWRALITRATRNRRNLLITFLVCWAWAPLSLLAAYGADIHSQIREYSWFWNQFTGLQQPYIGFFSFVPMDIYPTAHYLWPTNPTYLTDQHNIVLTIIYGAVAAVSRYFTGSNDAGIVLLAFLQFFFAAWCCASSAHRLLNRPWHSTLHSSTCSRSLLLIFWIISPSVVLSTIALTKSPLFAFAFLWWFGIMYEFYDTYRHRGDNTHHKVNTPTNRGWQTRIEFVLCICIMLIAAKYAWYVLLIQGVLLIVGFPKRWKTWLSCIILPTIAWHLALTLLISSGIIINGDPIESRGIQLQQIARIAQLDPGRIPKKAKKLLAPIFNLDQSAEAYKPNDADPVKSSGLQSKKVSYRWRYVTKDNLRHLNEAWWLMVTHSPIVAFDALAAKTYGYFDILDEPYVGVEYYIYTDSIRKSAWIQYWNPSWRQDVATSVRDWSSTPGLGWIIHGNTYVIATLLIGVAQILAKRWKTVLLLLPNALLMGVMLLAPANNFERHMLPILFIFPLICMIVHRERGQ